MRILQKPPSSNPFWKRSLSPESAIFLTPGSDRPALQIAVTLHQAATLALPTQRSGHQVAPAGLPPVPLVVVSPPPKHIRPVVPLYAQSRLQPAESPLPETRIALPSASA